MSPGEQVIAPVGKMIIVLTEKAVGQLKSRPELTLMHPTLVDNEVGLVLPTNSFNVESKGCRVIYEILKTYYDSLNDEATPPKTP